ncbi:hypothetical protein I551_8786 [Mycobacterium ulcerans str. Harvey]|uniref:Uncharacterized protein n=1 Tax=Mycobacterium ulcerans str. Harvey TaxID=1299332 RepID=A0ABN0R9U8_MYCUL|nr:hypothetical protein I551_8786 [Mycobacterium ulcerans str. Harvey]
MQAFLAGASPRKVIVSPAVWLILLFDRDSKPGAVSSAGSMTTSWT